MSAQCSRCLSRQNCITNVDQNVSAVSFNGWFCLFSTRVNPFKFNGLRDFFQYFSTKVLRQDFSAKPYLEAVENAFHGDIDYAMLVATIEEINEAAALGWADRK
jgi:hypothetical protein